METETTQKNELYITKCHSCRKVFRTDKPKEILCPDCLKFKQSSKPTRKKKTQKKPLTFAEILHIAKIYNKVKHKYLHYGDIVSLIERNAESCVCCGAIVYERLPVCTECEKAVE